MDDRNNMDDEKIFNILVKVIKATHKEKIFWDKNKKKESCFNASLGVNEIQIIESGSSLYGFVIKNKFGDTLGQIGGPFKKPHLRELYMLAKNQALKVEKNLDEIESFLDRLI